MGCRRHAVFHFGPQRLLEPVRLAWQKRTGRLPRAADFAHALWRLGQASYALLGNGRAVTRFCEGGIDKLAVIDLRRGTGRVLDLPYVEFALLTRIDEHDVACVAGSTREPDAILRINVDSGQTQVLRQASRALLEPDEVSTAIPIDFPEYRGSGRPCVLLRAGQTRGFVHPRGNYRPC